MTEISDEEFKAMQGRKRCCPQDTGGSHYHCGRCGGVTGMQGHFSAIDMVDGKLKTIEHHFCCPGDCENPGLHHKRSSKVVQTNDTEKE
jgi:hypothetical protein